MSFDIHTHAPTLDSSCKLSRPLVSTAQAATLLRRTWSQTPGDKGDAALLRPLLAGTQLEAEELRWGICAGALRCIALHG